MKYEAWTWEAVRDRVIEAAETLRLLPAIRGPKVFGSSMPEVVRRYDEAYGYGNVSYRRRAEGAAIDRMERTWEWVNRYLGEADRHLLYGWAAVKVRKGLSVARFAEEKGTYERMLRREIKRCCQIITNNLNQISLIRLNSDDCAVSESQSEQPSTTVSSEKCATHWRAPDAKPQVDPALAPVRVLKPRDIRARHSDKNRSLGAR